MSTIRIVAELVLKPGCQEALLPELQALVAGSQAEPGNLEYELTASLEDRNRLFVIETWASEEAIAAHNGSPHFQAFVKAAEGKLEKLTINKVHKIM